MDAPGREETRHLEVVHAERHGPMDNFYVSFEPFFLTRGQICTTIFDLAPLNETNFLTIFFPLYGHFQVLGTIGDQSPLKCIQRKKSQSRQSLLASPGGGLALKYEKLSVDSFERMVRLTFVHDKSLHHV